MLNLGQPIAKLVNLIPDEMDQGQFGRRIVRHYSPHPTTPPRRVASGGISPLQLWAADAVRAVRRLINPDLSGGDHHGGRRDFQAGMVPGESPGQAPVKARDATDSSPIAR